MTITPLLSQKATPSKTVNVFDLTSQSKSFAPTNWEESAKERAFRITICVIICMFVLTATSLIVAEAFGLQWRICSKPHNKTSHENWLHWPFLWKHNSSAVPLSETYQERWNTLTLPEKRNELFRATLGEVDLYDMYDTIKESQGGHTEKKFKFFKGFKWPN